MESSNRCNNCGQPIQNESTPDDSEIPDIPDTLEPIQNESTPDDSEVPDIPDTLEITQSIEIQSKEIASPKTLSADPIKMQVCLGCGKPIPDISIVDTFDNGFDTLGSTHDCVRPTAAKCGLENSMRPSLIQCPFRDTESNQVKFSCSCGNPNEDGVGCSCAINPPSKKSPSLNNSLSKGSDKAPCDRSSDGLGMSEIKMKPSTEPQSKPPCKPCGFVKPPRPPPCSCKTKDNLNLPGTDQILIEINEDAEEGDTNLPAEEEPTETPLEDLEAGEANDLPAEEEAGEVVESGEDQDKTGQDAGEDLGETAPEVPNTGIIKEGSCSCQGGSALPPKDNP